MSHSETCGIQEMQQMKLWPVYSKLVLTKKAM